MLFWASFRSAFWIALALPCFTQSIPASKIFLAIPAFTFDMGMGGKESYSGWKLLTDKAIGETDYTAVTWYRIFAWILVVLAIILIVLAVLQILANLNIIKLPEILAKVNNFALIALVVLSVLALIAVFGIRSEFIDPVKDAGLKGEALKDFKDMYAVGVSLWLISIVNLVAAACANVFAKAKD